MSKISITEALADCIMRFEGWSAPSRTRYSKGSISWRNRNPGNLRDSPLKIGISENGYAVFDSLDNGWKALTNDLDIKLGGRSIHDLTPKSTLHDFFSIYAPALDFNDPTQYSRQVADWLNSIYNIDTIKPETTLEELLKLG